MAERELSLSVVGIDYANTDKAKSNRRYEMLLCRPGEPVELRPEPKNKHDENAVAVFSERGIQLGYLTAERAPWIRGLMAADEVAAVFQEAGAGAAIIRAKFGGGMPTLPIRRVQVRTFDDFQPDPEGPEWGA